MIDATALGQNSRANVFVEAMIAGESLKTGTAGDDPLHAATPTGCRPVACPSTCIPEADLPGEQSNSSVVILPDFGILKFYRHLTVSGLQPEVEIGSASCRKSARKSTCRRCWAMQKSIFPDGDTAAVSDRCMPVRAKTRAMAGPIRLNHLNRLVDEYAVLDASKAATRNRRKHRDYLEFARTAWPVRTAEVHLALTADPCDNEAFAPEPVHFKTIMQRWLSFMRDASSCARYAGENANIRPRAIRRAGARSDASRDARDIDNAIATPVFDGLSSRAGN